MTGTKNATGGFRRITQLGPPVKLRFLGFVVVITLGAVLLGWLTRTIWKQLERLQREHAAVKSETFYLGVTLRSSVRSLNGKLLQFGMSRDPAVRDTFIREANELSQIISTNVVQLAELSGMRLSRRLQLYTDLELLRRIQRSYTNYLVQAQRIFTRGGPPADVDSFQEIYVKVQTTSKGLLADCDMLVAVQREGFVAFLGATQSTLLMHKRLLQGTVALLVVLAGTLSVLVWRGMIAPLRLRLTESKSIIERQEKLAALGVLASGVAHEIRNPLTAIKFRLFSMKKAVPDLSSNEDAGVISAEINRLERIVKDFLKFARPSEPELAIVPAGRLLNDAKEFLRQHLERSRIQITLDVQDELWVMADADQMKQVLINLIYNAAEATGQGGAVTLTLRSDKGEFDGLTEPAAILAVSDNGKGISPEVEPRLFDPFFTTKERGTGLGLAIAARIVEKHGGILRYETEMNKGTTFEIVLRRAQNA